MDSPDKYLAYQSDFIIDEYDRLKFAILGDNVEELKKVLSEYTMDLNSKCSEYGSGQGNTLVLACENGAYKVARELVSLGAELQFEALLMALSFNHPNLVVYLLDQGITPNHNCISNTKDINLIEILLAAGAPLNPEEDDYSALLNAIYEEDIGLLEFLLKKGMNPNLPLSWPPLVAACHFNEQAQKPLQVFKLLLDYGADRNTKDEGKTLLELIEENESIKNKREILELLSA